VTGPSEPRCDRTDLLVSACAHCRGEPSRPAGSAVIQRSVAVYRSRCGGCEETIEVGDLIALTWDGWVCEGCGTEAGP